MPFAEIVVTKLKGHRYKGIMNSLISRPIMMAAFSILCLTTASADLEEKIQKTFTPGPGGSLVMDIDRGSIDIRTSDRPLAEIQVTRKVNARTTARMKQILADHRIEFENNGAEIRIRSRSKPLRKFGWFRRERLNVRYVITLPKKFDTNVKTSGGPISIANLDGQVKAATSGGGLRFEHIQGPLWGRTSGGDVEVESCGGVIDVETSGGNLTIHQAESSVTAKTSGGSIRIDGARGDVLARTSGGDIDIHRAAGKVNATTSGGSVSATVEGQPEGACRLQTSGGDIEISLPVDAALNVHASTSGGRIVNEFSAARSKNQSDLRTQINGGGPALEMHTSGGSVYIKKRSRG
jgi:DUF4097 and DUF4098 domain-containing protein YvlB